MMRSRTNRMAAILLAGCLAPLGAALAQSSPSTQSGQNPSAQSPSQNRDQKPADNGTSLGLPAQPAANPDEEAALKAFQAMPNNDLPQKIATGEDFLKKYPESQFRPIVYSALVFEYLETNNTQKAFDVGDKELALKPDDVQVMAALSQTIPRVMTPNTPEPGKQLAKAETYAKRAIEITPTLPKPDNMADQTFVVAKNQTLTMAHSGLGLVYIRMGKYKEAIPELEQSVKIDPNPSPDPVNWYLLGMANQKASHFDEAAAAFNKCATISSKLQDTCKNGADAAKKQSATQLSSPR